MAVVVALALSLAGCGTAGDVAIGFIGATLLGPLIGAAVGSAQVRSYCETPTEALYTTDHWHCANGDTELKPWDYSRMQADRAAAAQAETHAKAMAELAQPTYCRTAISHSAYRSPSRSCEPGDAEISADDYNQSRADAAAAATKIPAGLR